MKPLEPKIHIIVTQRLLFCRDSKGWHEKDVHLDVIQEDDWLKI